MLLTTVSSTWSIGHTHTRRFNSHFSRWTWVSRLPR